MNTENVETFLRALRSGHYNQAQERLAKTNGEVAYCCLGVGSLLAGCQLDGDEFMFTNADGETIWLDTLPGREFFDWLGVDADANVPGGLGDIDQGADLFLDVGSEDGKMPVLIDEFGKEGESCITLAGLNDWGLTFSQIADMVEYFGFIGADVKVPV